MTEENQQILMDYVRQATDFGVAQAPLVAQEILSYGFWSSLVWLILSTTLVVLSLVIPIRLIQRDPLVNNCPTFIAPFVGGLLGIPMLCIGCEACLIQIKIHTAPRLYVLEQAAGLLGG